MALTDFNSKVVSQNKLFYVYNLTPTKPSANVGGGGWSTLTVFRSDGLFEAFALIWTEAFAVPVPPRWHAPAGGRPDRATHIYIYIYIIGIYPTPSPKMLGYSDAVAALRAGFVCSAQIIATLSPQQRSPRLQSYVAAGSYGTGNKKESSATHFQSCGSRSGDSGR